MEEISSSNLLHLALLFVPLSLVFLVYKRKSAQVKLPPGTNEWPFLGESLEFVKDARRGHPEKFINDRTKKYSPNVFRTSLLGENMAVFCGASGNKSERSRRIMSEFLKSEGLQHLIPSWIPWQGNTWRQIGIPIKK
ncbi:hypothetical protein GH714_022523 [Hevea brasiliensis]|uniref:Cytochrome P450 n=1 Tax=Hevea brasiliensis TaxID=3981 RepID=A0A6A6LCN5_HEVBR|nr:hypothetical protein GH714_022523 [Hevea brasiliensis]